MGLGIFGRLILGYLLIFFAVLALSLYAMGQLERFHQVAHSILEVDNQVIDLGKKMSDSLLSQMRYERKYMILRDSALYEQFLLARNDFQQHLSQAQQLAAEPSFKEALDRIQQQHARYLNLVEEEVGNIRDLQPYPVQRFNQEKEKAIDQVLQNLKALTADTQTITLDRIKELEKAGISRRKIVAVLALVALLALVASSFFITRSITRPVSALIAKTREISKGIFKGDLALSSPPEIGELTQAFNSMCVQLQAVDTMKSDFFAAMSHELRTPLTSIKEGTSLLLDGIGGEIPERQRKILNIISGESNRMIDLVNATLDLSKMDAGMVAYNFEAADMAPLIEQAMRGIKPLAMAKEIGFQVASHPPWPPVRVDRERILQVLRNLIGNAIKFTPERGQVTVDGREKEGGLEICVRDSGPGLSREHLSLIFEKYRQGPVKTLPRIKGTGLGLAIVKHIVTAHGGKVWAESEPGQGSSFFFWLPA